MEAAAAVDESTKTFRAQLDADRAARLGGGASADKKARKPITVRCPTACCRRCRTDDVETTFHPRLCLLPFRPRGPRRTLRKRPGRRKARKTRRRRTKKRKRFGEPIWAVV